MFFSQKALNANFIVWKFVKIKMVYLSLYYKVSRLMLFTVPRPNRELQAIEQENLATLNGGHLFVHFIRLLQMLSVPDKIVS